MTGQLFLPATELQAGGFKDDGSEQGLVRVQSVISGLVRLPFLPGQYSLSSNTAPSVQPTYKADIYRENSDGSCSGIGVIVTQGSAGSTYVSRIVFAFYGKVLALRWARGIAAGGYPRDFTCVIDGVCYNVSNQAFDPRSGSAYTTPSGESCVVIDDNLRDGQHICELAFPGAVDQANRWLIYGYAVESRTGANPYPRRMSWCNPQVLTTGMVYVDVSHHGETSVENLAYGIRRLAYSNSSASPVTVTIENYYNSTAATLAVLTVPANGTAEYSFPGPVAYDHAGTSGRRGLRHKASANSVITAQALGDF